MKCYVLLSKMNPEEDTVVIGVYDDVLRCDKVRSTIYDQRYGNDPDGCWSIWMETSTLFTGGR